MNTRNDADSIYTTPTTITTIIITTTTTTTTTTTITKTNLNSPQHIQIHIIINYFFERP